MKLTIDRTTWLRGEGEAKSMLLRASDGKMCCLGFYGRAMGAAEDALLDVVAPQCAPDPTPFAALLDRDGCPTDACGQLMLDNDRRETDDVERERRITEGFAQIGIEVEFVSDNTPAGRREDVSEKA